MTYLEFCHWVNGYFQLSRDDQMMLDHRKIQIIYNHLILAETISGAAENEVLTLKKQLQLCLDSQLLSDFTQCSKMLKTTVNKMLMYSYIENTGADIHATTRK